MTRWQKHGTTSNATLTILHYFTSLFQIIGPRVYPLKALIEVLEFRVWLSTKFGRVTHFKNKQYLLDALLESANLQFSKAKKVRGVFYVEFGVAFGETSKYLISGTKVPFVYHGFDTFEGLPKAWRNLPGGAFSANGEKPKIAGENIYFYKGLIKETIRQVDFKSNLMKIFIFDFDLYEPTLFALNYVFSEIKKGDIVYFDEAFDSNERVVIENHFLDSFEFEIIGASPFGLAFRIKKRKI
jgi:hypothetical protein